MKDYEKRTHDFVLTLMETLYDDAKIEKGDDETAKIDFYKSYLNLYNTFLPSFKKDFSNEE